MNTFSRKRIFWLLSFIFSFLLGGLLIVSIGLFTDYQKIPSGHMVGNKASNVKALKEKGFPFSFLVIGDPQGSHRGTILMEKAFREGDFSFMIILGDFVNKPDVRCHYFFLKTMKEKIKPPFPVLLVSGNHDVDYRPLNMKQSEWRTTPDIYESLYGPRNFVFVFNECLFIILGIDPQNPRSYLSYLRNTLSEKGEKKKYIFVFTHHPPKGMGVPGSFHLPNEEEFFTLLEEYKVTTCFFGDYHAYWRGQRKGTNFVVSGGGGGVLKKWQPAWGKFHHLMRITVDENTVSEGIMILPAQTENVAATFKKWVFINLFPIKKSHGWILNVLVFVFLSWGVYSVIIVFRHFLKKG